MIHDLQGSGANSVIADILIVGAGTAGLVMADALASHGLRVVCLESGGMEQKDDEHPLNEVVQHGAAYGGAAHGRFRCLGGTSTRWGGALIPFAAGDLADALWPVDREEILRYLPDVERLFALPAGPYEDVDLLGGAEHHVARFAKWPAFRRRNVANLLKDRIEAETGPEIWLNATVTRFSVEDGRLRNVFAQAPDGATVTVSSRITVIAAGAIETTRLLLLLDRQNDGLLTSRSDHLGRYFHDHLSVVIGRLKTNRRRTLNRLTGIRFERGGVMRNLRFELKDRTPLRAELPASFAHIACEDLPDSGFGSLRELFRTLQQRRMPDMAMIGRLAAHSPWLVRAVWWRFVEKRLLYADKADVQVHMVIEQEPVPDNRITLSSDRTDIYGQPLAAIHWSPGSRDCENLTRAADAFERMWNASPFAKLGALIRRPAGEAEAELARGSGIYHPGGTTRFAQRPEDGVVDTDLRLFGLQDVRVVSTSVLPSGGGANPTMMLLMLAFRCVADIRTSLAANRDDMPRNAKASDIADQESQPCRL